MNQLIDFEAFVSAIRESIDADEAIVSQIVIDLFAQVRLACEAGTWVYIEGVGSFHPLWYGMKKAQISDNTIQMQDDLLEKPQKHKASLSLPYTKKVAIPLIKKEEVSKPYHNTSHQEEERLNQKLKIAQAWEERKLQHYHASLLKEQSKEKKIDLKKYTNQSDFIASVAKIWSHLLALKHRRFWFALAVLCLLIFLLLSLKKNHQETIKDLNTTQSATRQYQPFREREHNASLTLEKNYPCTIKKGDTLYAISYTLYGDTKYWPLIYANNVNTIQDMDRIYPGATILIPRIPQGSSADSEMADVYIKAYQSYKALGKADKAQWLLFWGRKHIDKDLLKTYSTEIEEADRIILKEYIERFDRP